MRCLFLIHTLTKALTSNLLVAIDTEKHIKIITVVWTNNIYNVMRLLVLLDKISEL